MAITVPPEMAGGGDHSPPQNVDAEVAVLGSVLFAPNVLATLDIEVKLKPEDFYSGRNRIVYAAMRRLQDKADPSPVDSVTLLAELERASELEQAGGEAYVRSLGSAVPAAGHFKHYAQIVKDLAQRRRLMVAAQEIQEQVFSFQGGTPDLLEQSESKLFKIGHDDATGALRSIADVLHVEIDKLEQVSREGVSMTGTPSGYKDLDELTGGFQPGNLIVLAARPSMGKCLPGSALVLDPTTGRRRRMDEIVAAIERGEDVWVSALGPDLKLRTQRASASFRNGVRPLLRLRTKLGRQVEATGNHPVLTMHGWTPIDELEPGDRVAVPRKLPSPLSSELMADHDLVLLAALIADGNLTQNSPRFCFGEDSPVLPEVERAAAALGCRLQCSAGSNGTACISAGRGGPPNPVRLLMQEHGQWGKGSAAKFVPDAIFELPPEQIARFLSVLYGCDGHVYASDRLRQIGYTTISERLAHGVQHLLLRLGVVSKIRKLKRDVYEGTTTVAREVLITGQRDLEVFCETVRVCGKEDRLERVLDGLGLVGQRTNVDTIPAAVWDRVEVAKGDLSWRQMAVATGRPVSHNWHVGRRGLSRSLLGEIADWSNDPELEALARSDVWWDEVISIEPAGEAETYDIEVPEDHNFVADDFCVHNSALVTNMAENASVDYDKPVALFSLEMSETELAQRFVASQAKLNGDDLRKGKISADRWPKVLKATENLAGAPLYVDDSSDIGIHELRAKARRLHTQHGGLGLVIVDYLQLMRPEDSSQSRVEQIGQISRGLKILARELKIPVIAVSQLSRAVESRPDKRPLLSDLRESGQIEQDADLVMFIYRDEYYNPKETERPGEADLIISKHRNGPVGEITLAFVSRHPKFANLYRDRAVDQPAAAGGDF
ncbi:MAG: replicative DNA helicase [Thermoleophilaceae bacterium]|nr:replicative DNA helicase [Thermoleophilaceae bacterium]